MQPDMHVSLWRLVSRYAAGNQLIIGNVYAFSVVECAHDPLLVALHRFDTVAVGQICNDVRAAAVVVCFTLLMPTFAVMFKACKYRIHSHDIF